MTIIDIKFTKFDNTPWGFRLVGGSDFPQPLTVIKVLEYSLAECMGLRPGDVIVRLNDRPIASLTHGQAHEALVLAGNNFTLGVHRTKDAQEAIEALEPDNIVPYTIPLEELKPVIPLAEPLEDPEEPEDSGEDAPEDPKVEEEPEIILPDKPVDENSELVPNKNLTDDEIADLILQEEELLAAGDQGVLGVNFKKLRPRAPLLRESKVLEELQTIALEEPPRVLELKHKSTFLQKPERPVPVAKKHEEPQENQEYKVVIRKQTKKSVTERLQEQGLLQPLAEKQIIPVEAVTNDDVRVKTPEEQSRPETACENVENQDETDEERFKEVKNESPDIPDKSEDKNDTEVADNVTEELAEVQKNSEPDITPIFDKDKVKELVSTEISLEKQLESVQSQLMALKQLPSEIENHLRIVSEQLHKIMELSGVQNVSGTSSRRDSSDQQCNSVEEKRVEKDEEERATPQDTENSEETHFEDPSRSSSAMSYRPPVIVEPELEEIEPPETKELEVTVTSPDDHRVKKYVATYETRVFRSRDPSPAPSHGSFEPDPNLSPRDQVIQELKHKGGNRKRSGDLWPQAKQLELTYGRRWRCPNDFFNDEMIAEVLSGQAEVIRGRALGVNFKKYEKEWLPNYDHLMNSSVYKMLHKMEREPKSGIPARPPKVPAAQDILERVNSPA